MSDLDFVWHDFSRYVDDLCGGSLLLTTMTDADVQPFAPGALVVDYKGFSPSGVVDLIEYWGAEWGLVYAFARARTGVATTELVELVGLTDAFAERHVKVVAVCSDSMDSVIKFAQEIKQSFDGARVAFPIIADADGDFATAYGLSAPGADGFLSEAHHILVVSPDHRVQLSLSYPRACGFNFKEVLRSIDALRVSFYCSGAMTSANWAPGEDVFVPVEMSDEEAVKAFSKGFKAVVPYLRLTPQPDMRDGTEEDEEDEVQLTRIATAASGVRPGTGK